jgi:hypothetical protein
MSDARDATPYGALLLLSFGGPGGILVGPADG